MLAPMEEGEGAAGEEALIELADTDSKGTTGGRRGEEGVGGGGEESEGPGSAGGEAGLSILGSEVPQADARQEGSQVVGAPAPEPASRGDVSCQYRPASEAEQVAVNEALVGVDEWGWDVWKLNAACEVRV